MSDLRSNLIHLAHGNPDLRGDILPLVSGENRTASDAELRASVIRLAHGKPALRETLLPLVTAKGKVPEAFKKQWDKKDKDDDGKTDEKKPDFLKDKDDKKDESDKDSGKGKKAAKDIVAALKAHPERDLAMGLVRVANEHPEFKADILPLLREAADFPAGSIGEQKSGPQQQEPDEPYMGGEFTQKENAELRQRQEAGNIALPDKAASEDALRKGLIRLAHDKPEFRKDLLPLLQG